MLCPSPNNVWHDIDVSLAPPFCIHLITNNKMATLTPLCRHRIPLQKPLKEFAQRRKVTNKLSGDEVKDALKFTSLVDILPRTSGPALIGCDSTSASDGGRGIPTTSRTRPLTHFRLVDFISNEFNLKKFGLHSGDRVGVCLPQGIYIARFVVISPLITCTRT